MALVAFSGFETGDFSELAASAAGMTIVSDVKQSGAYSLKVDSAAATVQAVFTGINKAHSYYRFTFRASWGGVLPGTGQFWICLPWRGFNTSAAMSGQLQIYIDEFGVWTILVYNNDFSAFDAATITVVDGQQHTVELDWTVGAGTGAALVKFDGVTVINVSSKQYGAANLDAWHGFASQGDAGSKLFWIDDMAVDDTALPGAVAVLARQFKAGSPTYDAWTKSLGGGVEAEWSETPFSATKNASSAVLSSAQTGLIYSFSDLQEGHGYDVAEASATVKGVKVGIVAKTEDVATLKGALLGTLVITAASITNPFIAVGSVAVKIGDLVVALMAQQTGNTITAVTDNLGNTYSAQNAGTDGGTVTGRMFYSRVTVAGTLTAVNAACTASANDAAFMVACFRGPFAVGPIDANPANKDGTDIASPFTCPATGVLAQAEELVIAWMTETGQNVTYSATSPNLKALQAAPSTNILGILGYQTVAATTSISPEFTGTNPTDAIQGTASFKFAAGAQNGSAASIRRRTGGADTDTAKTLTTTDAYYEGPIFIPTLSDLNAGEAGVLHGLHSYLQTVEEAWVMLAVDAAVIVRRREPVTPRYAPVRASVY